MAEDRPFLDFKAIKARAPITAILDRYTAKLIRVNQATLKGNCPLPTHSSKSKNTFYVSEAKSAWYCHSDSCKKNGNRAGGNVIDFVAAMENISIYDAADNRRYCQRSKPKLLEQSAVILLVFWEAHRQLLRADLPVPKKLVVCCLLSGLAAVLARELTYSSLLEQMSVALLAVTAIGLVCVPPHSADDTGERARFALRIEWAAAVFAMAAGYGYFITQDHERGDAQIRVFYSRMLGADFTGARRSIDRAIKLWPDNARYHVWKGYCLSQLLPPQCAREPVTTAEGGSEFRAALLLNDRDGVAHHDLAWLEHLAGNDSEARKEWRRAVEIDPDNAVFHLSFGMFLEEAGDGQGATDQFVRAVQLSPAILDSPMFARHPDWAKTSVERCIAETEGRLKRGSDPVLKARLGKYYLFTNDLPRAARTLQEAARELPNLPLVWFNLGEVFRLQGDSAQALACYERARYLDGRLPGPHLRIGELDQSGHAIEELRLASQRWARMNPVTAAHNNRLYHGSMQQIDDLLPTTLVWYVSPCEASEAYGELAKLYPSNGSYAQKSHACEEIPDPHRF
jgi:tetratricopeptide (TPR) repeat protein